MNQSIAEPANTSPGKCCLAPAPTGRVIVALTQCHQYFHSIRRSAIQSPGRGGRVPQYRFEGRRCAPQQAGRGRATVVSMETKASNKVAIDVESITSVEQSRSKGRW